MRILVVLLLSARVALAQPAPDDDLRSPALAVGLSLGGTAAGVGLIVGGMKRHSIPAEIAGTALVAVGPTLGHIYAGRTWNRGLGVRMLTLAAALVGGVMYTPCLSNGCGHTKDVAGTIVVASAIVYGGASLYEIGSAGKAACEYNAHVTVAPAPAGAVLSLSGRF